MFWSSSIEDIKRGYIYDETSKDYTCLICGKVYSKGIIYPNGDLLLEAQRAMENHISKDHGSVFDYLINMNKKYTGLTEVQRDILEYFYKGLSDKEIVKEQGGGSTSTVRNHRFKLKEKEKQAKVFLAIMELLEAGVNKEDNGNNEKLVNIHKGANMVDERFAITEKEMEKVLKTYIKEGKLTQFPSKEKKKIVILQHIIKDFEINKEYSEKEVNEIIEKYYFDFVTIRRYFIEYGFMERSKDCRSYWVKL